MTNVLCGPYSRDEVEKALNQMHPIRLPDRTDSILSFFKNCRILWVTMSSTILAILNGHSIPPKLNHIYVTLIPKKPKPDAITEYPQLVFVMLLIS